MNIFILLFSMPIITGIIVFLFKFKQKVQKFILIGTALIHLLFVINMLFSSFYGVINEYIGIDSAGKLVLSIVSIIFFTVSLHLCDFLYGESERTQNVSISCLLFLLSSMTLATFSRHMGILWIAIEATTLLSAPLISFHKTQKSIEATWKYLLISSLGIAMALLGTLFLAIASPNASNLSLDNLFIEASNFSMQWLKLSIIFLIIGYGTKMGLSPMHTWKPDAYGEAPYPIGALFAGALTGIGFLAFFRIAQICHYSHLYEAFSSVFILLGILSLGIAAIFITDQKYFSRLLGYSSIEHMGIIVLGLGIGGEAIWASFYHLINNAFIKGLIFLSAGNICKIYKTKKIEDIQGSIHVLPLSSIFLLIAFIAILGFPPFGIFYSELIIFKELIYNNNYIIAFLYFLFLTVIFFGFSKIIINIVFGDTSRIKTEVIKENKFALFPLGILTILLFVISIFFSPALSQILTNASMLLGGK